jgi:hypothetical protein
LIIYAFGIVFASSGLSQVVFVQSSVHSSILIQDVRFFSLPVQVLSFSSKPLLRQVVIRLMGTARNETQWHLLLKADGLRVQLNSFTIYYRHGGIRGGLVGSVAVFRIEPQAYSSKARDTRCENFCQPL